MLDHRMCSDFSCDVLRVEVVLGFISQRYTRFLRFGFLQAAAVLFVVSAAEAQNRRLVANDGTLTPDYERADHQGEEGSVGQGASDPSWQPEPQDPLNKTYDSQSSRALDRRDRDRMQAQGRTLLPSPLDEVPRDFRDDEFVYQLAQDAYRQSQQQDRGWRRRDDQAFAPLGITVGSFVFYPEIYSQLITSNNLFASKSDQKSALGTQITPAFRLRSDWNNHQLEFYGTSRHRRWRDFSSENTDEFELRTRGRFDITRRTSLEGGGRYEQSFEGRGANELPDGAATPAKTHKTTLFGQVNHRFNRLGFRFRGELIQNEYDNVVLNSGAVSNNHQRDYDEHLVSLRTSYEFSPRLSVYADAQLGQRIFSQKRDDNGFAQGSESWLGALGARIELSSNLSLLGRFGYRRIAPDEARYGDLEGVVYDARLIWLPTRLTTLTIDGKTEFEETTQSGSPGSLNRSASGTLDHFWTHRFSTKFTAGYEVRDYAGIRQIDKELRLGLGTTYLLSRSWSIDAGYERTRVEGANAYKEDVFHLGLKWQR